MQSGPTTCRQDFDFVDDLSAGIEGKTDREDDQNASQSLANCPHLRVNIFGKERIILLDSGSQITTISDDFYKELSRKQSLKTLPVANLYVTTAIGKKSTTIKQQVRIDVEIVGIKIGFPFLIIPYLTSTIILGNNWMLRNKVILNYKNNTVEVAGKLLSESTVMFERGASETLLCSRNERETFVYVINLQHLSQNQNKEAENSQENMKQNEKRIDSKGEVSLVRGKQLEAITWNENKLANAMSSNQVVSSITRDVVECSNENKTPYKNLTLQNEVTQINIEDNPTGCANEEGFFRGASRDRVWTNITRRISEGTGNEHYSNVSRIIFEQTRLRHRL